MPGGAQRPAISVRQVHKYFALPHERNRSVKSSFLSAFSRNRRIETQHVLDDISMEIMPGEFFGIVGRNGSGKSTLLKILAGIYQPSRGIVSVRGKLVPFIELGVGFNPELTGRENVYLNGALLGFSRTEIDGLYDDIVLFAELERFMDQKLKNYSSGMQVRLAFSLAIRAKADILLIDEVLAVGDADFQRKCFNYFRELKKSKTTVVFVSHDMNAVVEYCDKVALVDKSRLIMVDDAETVSVAYNRLFDDHEELRQNEADGEEPRRWGDEAIVVTSCAANKKKFNANDDLVTLSVTARCNQEVGHNVSVGFMVKNAAGVSILGNNTYVQHHKITDVVVGEELRVEWQVPNVFGDGDYLVDVAVTSSDGSINHDWWQEAGHFRVIRDERTPYIVTPRVPVRVDRRLP